jgi:hypothetical protein
MGPVNWIGVIVAGLVAGGVLIAMLRMAGLARMAGTVALTLLGSAMLGHALARIGVEKLALKPQLYFMQSGGLALAFVIPALWISGWRRGTPARQSGLESLAFALAYLAMGLVFRLLA